MPHVSLNRREQFCWDNSAKYRAAMRSGDPLNEDIVIGEILKTHNKALERLDVRRQNLRRVIRDGTLLQSVLQEDV